MKRILINATQNEEIRVALCKGNHLYDFDLENRTREQKKSNIYKGHVTRVEPSLEAVFVEYGSQRQGFLPIREISSEYLSGNPRDENIKKLIKEGDELIVQVEKEERGNKGAALSTYVSLAGRYLVLMPNNPRGGGISRQISGKLREDMKRMLGNLDLEKGMSVIIRTAGIGKTQEDLQHDLNHLLNIWQAIQEQNQKYPSPRLVHQEAGVVTRAVRDYLRDDIAEIWIDNENAYIEAAGFIDAVMPTQAEKLRKYTDYEPMFSRFNIEKQIETAYQREVRLPSGGSIVIDQTEALVSIDINSAKSTKGSDVAETAYHTNLEAADEIARQLRLRDMGGLIVIDFIDMNDNKHQKEVEKRLVDATKYDRARVQFGEISKFGLMEMSRQRLRPSLEESTGYICPRCHGNGMIRDLRSLSLSIMRQIEQIALKERQGEVQAEVPTDIAAFLLNEKRDSLVYLEQDSGTRITILPHAHLESPNFKLHFNRDGFAPSSYERITDTQQQEHRDLGYNVDWQTAEKERPEQQPTRQPRKVVENQNNAANSPQNTDQQNSNPSSSINQNNDQRSHNNSSKNGNEQTTSTRAPQSNTAQSNSTASNATQNGQTTPTPVAAQSAPAAQPQAVAWLSNLFAQAPQAQTTSSVSSRDAAEAIEALVNTGAQSLGSFGQVDSTALSRTQSASTDQKNSDNQQRPNQQTDSNANASRPQRNADNVTDDDSDDRRKRKPRKSRPSKPHQRSNQSDDTNSVDSSTATASDDSAQSDVQDKREQDNQRSNDGNRNRNNSDRNSNNRNNNDRNNSTRNNSTRNDNDAQDSSSAEQQTRTKRKPHSLRSSRGTLERGETLVAGDTGKQNQSQAASSQTNSNHKAQANTRRNQDPNEVMLQVSEAPAKLKAPEVVHLSLDDSKSENMPRRTADKPVAERQVSAAATDESNTQRRSDKPVDTASQSVNEQQVDTSINKQTDTDEQAQTVTPSVSQTADTQTTASKSTVSEPIVTEASLPESDEALVATPEPVVPTTSITTEKVEAKPDVESKPTDNDATPEVTDHTNVTVANDSKIVKADSGSAEVNDSAEVSDSPKVDDSVTVSNSTKESDNAEVPSAAIELTHETLFSSRYVTANKFGQASNDPRVVRQQQSQTTAVAVSAPVAVANAPAIRGTVGDFIHATLPDALTRLADSGVIRSFIDAITIYSQQSQSPETASAENSAADNDEVEITSFTFSNYGYQPLAADYLARFDAMTQAVSQFAATQGKTPVEPRAIDKRASNDPRGQHPDYQAPAVVTVSSEPVAPPSQDDQAQDVPSQEGVPSENNPSETGQPEDNHSQEVFESVATQINDSTQTDSLLDAHNVEATALTGQAQADDISIESEHMLQDNQHQSVVATEQVDEPVLEAAVIEGVVKDNHNASKSKTTIASYKNMIENVAEQLSPQTGMFNLTTPKVPKARSRKPKNEHKKPTQAEKIETDDTDADS